MSCEVLRPVFRLQVRLCCVTLVRLGFYALFADAHEMNGYRTDYVGFSSNVIELRNCRTDLDGILYGHYIIGMFF
jgi:hypothetical protein